MLECVGGELFLGFRHYLPRTQPGRLFAGFIGGYVRLYVVLVNWLVYSVRGEAAPVGLLLACAGVSLAHLAYAFTGPRGA